ncbi:thioesterase family protein [Evansella sp. AB-P1]|uniref:acyl-CoA thioesterase n=1 Tax=Evansella sp. AB-P1 TaxID=3037653 RepID=UPI00241F3666|nr:thioesterase family protein [Evansella sp. AB-P1]MDG5788845.1 thioesterase family protein [Evansella sp. AB-P1]
MKQMEYELKVHFGDTDPAGIVFYPNYYRWMDQSTHHYFTKIGFPTSKLINEDGIGIPIVEAKCQFKAPLLFDDMAVVRSAIVEVRNKVFTIEHQFFREEKKVAEGYEIRAWCDISQKRPKAMPITNDVRNAIDQFQLA